MSKPFRDLCRRTFLRKSGNLVSLDSPYPVMKRLLKGHTVRGILDAGASDGRISKRLIRLFPQATAYLFEPNPVYAQALAALSRRDHRYRPFTCALSNHETQVRFYQTPSPGECSLFEPMGGSVERSSTVAATTVDAWSRQQDHPSVQLMKLDIQGGELAALRGAGQTLDRGVLLVYTEVLFNPMYKNGAIFSEVDLLLRSHGFELYNLYSPKSDDRDALRWANAIYWHRGKLDHRHATPGLETTGPAPSTDA